MLDAFYLYLSFQHFLEGTYWCLDAMKQFKELTERKTLYAPEKYPTTKVGFAFQDIQHRGTCKEHMKRGMGVIDLLQFYRPPLVLVHLIDIKPFSTLAYKLGGSIDERMG